MITSGIFLHDVSFRYSGSTGMALSHLTAHIPKGSFYGITGSNGSGKTTISYLLNGLIPHEIEGKLDGEITVDGESTTDKPVSHLAKKVGVVFQNPDLMIFNLTVAEEVEFGLRNLGLGDTTERARNALSQVGLSGMDDRDPHGLSLGQKQKLCIAVALAMDTDYLVLDEPSSMLDYKSSIELYELLRRLNDKGKTIIVIEHDTDFIFTYATHTIVMKDGGLEMDARTEDVFTNTEKITSLGVKVGRKIGDARV